MPNIATVLKEEIRRLARKEVKAQLADLKAASARYRKDLAALKRKIAEQDRALARLGKARPAATRAAPTSTDPGTQLRFSPSWVSKHREKLELSAADYGMLVGVSGLTIYNWEKGKTKPRDKQLAGWAEIRGLGKREAWKRLEMMEQ